MSGPRKHLVTGRVFPALCLFLVLAGVAVPARASAGDGAERRAEWVKPVATTAITYGTLYAAVLTAVTGARLTITALAPLEWLSASLTFGTPLFVIPVMAQLVPAVRQWAPAAAEALERSLGGGAAEPDYAAREADSVP